MSEREFLQQLFLLKCDIEAPMLDVFSAQQRERWVLRLGDLLNRRNSAKDPLAEVRAQRNVLLAALKTIEALTTDPIIRNIAAKNISNAEGE